MDIQDFHNLQEAYLEVVENQQLDEGYKPWDFGPRDKAKAKYDTLVQKKVAGGSAPGTATRANKIASVGKEMRRTLDADSAATGTDPKKQGLQPSTQRHTRAAMRGADGGTTARTMFKKEEIDLYDIILSHLLDEGYAETLEAAEAIMVNMSEDWREGIVEANAGPSTPVKIDPKMGIVPNLGAARPGKIRPKGIANLPGV